MHRLTLAVGLALLLCAGASAQGVPGTRAAVEGQRGWDAIRQGRHEEAAEAFAAAVASEPRDPSLRLGAGVAAQRLGHIDDAKRSLERALELWPPFTAASLLLGDILYRNNELEAAQRVFEAARVHAPGNTALASRLEQVQRESALQSNFFLAQGAHFTVAFEGVADEELARRALEILEAAYWRVGTSLLIFPERTIPVVLYTEQQFRDVTRYPAWAAAAYDGRIRVPMRGALANPEELERVLTHELTHALIQSVAPQGVPTWLNEGLAVLFESKGSEWADGQLKGSSARLPIQRLAAGFGALSDAQARMAYAQSASTVRAILNEAGSHTLIALLQDVARGEAFDAAFERRMLTPFAQFVTSLDAPR